METLFVYGLVVVFFLLLIPVIYFLMQDPIARTDQELSSDNKQRAFAVRIPMEQTVAYGILAALFTLMCVLTVLVHRTKS